MIWPIPDRVLDAISRDQPGLSGLVASLRQLAGHPAAIQAAKVLADNYLRAPGPAPKVSPLDMLALSRVAGGGVAWLPELRAALGGATQAEMAARCGASLPGYQKWEEGVRKPRGPARLLLAQLAAEAEAIRARKSG